MVDEIFGACEAELMLTRAEVYRYYRRDHEARSGDLPEQPWRYAGVWNYRRQVREDIRDSVRFYSNQGVWGRKQIFDWFDRLDLERRLAAKSPPPADLTLRRNLLRTIRNFRINNPPDMFDLHGFRADHANTRYIWSDEDCEQSIRDAIQAGVPLQRHCFEIGSIGFAWLRRELMRNPPVHYWAIHEVDAADTDGLVTCVLHLSHVDDWAKLVELRFMNPQRFGERDD